MVTRRGFIEGVVGTGLLVAGASRATLAAEAGAMDRARSVARVVPPTRAQVGEVFKVKRTIPALGLDDVDPFLMLDNFDFTLAPGQLGGLAPHPHRGFETVTVMAEGEIEHGDSLGNRGKIGSGDIQWMTAGDGIVHEENPSDGLRERGGRVLGVQLWVNLPSSMKKVSPKYQDKTAAEVPVVDVAGVRARVFAGRAHDVVAPISTFTPIGLVDYVLQPGASARVAWPETWSAFVQAVDGVVTVGDDRIPEGGLALTRRDAGAVLIRNESSRPVRALLGGGEPIGEPYASYGPFVMSSEADLRESIERYRSGRMGRVPNPTYDRVRSR
jgi:hypothetical protein